MRRATTDDRVDGYNDVVLYLADMDTDCNPKLTSTNSVENPTGLTPEAMAEKMDILLQVVVSDLANGFDDDFYTGLLEVFENVVLKLHHPHYVHRTGFFVFQNLSTMS